MGSIYRHPILNGFDPETPNQTSAVAGDYFDGVFDYIKQMLMEEEDDDSDHRLTRAFLADSSALQACEKYFHDALIDPNRTVLSENSPDDAAQWSLGPSALTDTDPCVRFGQGSSSQGKGIDFPTDDSNFDSDSNMNGKKSHSRDDSGGDYFDRRTKQLAMFEDEPMTEKYDKALFCEKMNPGFYDDLPRGEMSGDEVDTKFKKVPEAKRGRPKGTTKKQTQVQPQRRVVKEVIDLRNLLTRCAQAVSTSDHAVAQEILAKIRQHASPYGDANERLSHCFANALEARLAGTGSMLYAASSMRRISTVEHLKAYQSYVTACPFKRMSNIFANKTIAKHTREADKIHIVDFGISHGFQWPCIIQGVSLRPGGPPTLKITGIDFPEPGFKPGEKVEQTGRRLASFCKRFNVSFEYNAVAKNLIDVNVDDLKLKPDEMLVVNCLYRMRHVPDESRDAVLNLIRKIKPHIFVHGVVNGTYNAPFFTTRFREVLYHYSSFFDMMEATMPREDQDRMMYERDVFGREVMNVVACEGWERVDRPASYKQWRARNRRAGFRKVGLDRDIMEEVKVKVRGGYQGDYTVEEDGEWLLQGWKGRALYALSCWKPSHE